MKLLAIFLILGCMAAETAQQILFRLAGRDRSRFLRRAVPAVGFYAIDMACWLLLLKLLPLGVALPFKAASYAVIPLAGRVVFKERVDRRRWFGIALIVVGVAIAAASQEGS